MNALFSPGTCARCRTSTGPWSQVAVSKLTLPNPHPTLCSTSNGRLMAPLPLEPTMASLSPARRVVICTPTLTTPTMSAPASISISSTGELCYSLAGVSLNATPSAPQVFIHFYDVFFYNIFFFEPSIPFPSFNPHGFYMLIYVSSFSSLISLETHRQVLVLKCDQGFVGFKANSNKLECNKASYDTITVEKGELGQVFFKSKSVYVLTILY